MIAFACLLFGCLACAALWRGGCVIRRRLHRALDQVETVQRTARLASLDLREAALRLHGQAAAPRTAPNSAAALAAVAQRCRILADDLGLVGRSADAPMIHEEPIDLLDCAREAAEAVAVTIAPGRRHFRIPDIGEARIWADRRAIRQVLGRVLTEAALNTGEDDWVVLGLADGAGPLVLEVADEGRGLAGGAAGQAATPGHDFRGISTGLALARALMEAHGGRLELVAAPRTGTRVSLWFPAQRRRGLHADGVPHAIRATQPS